MSVIAVLNIDNTSDPVLNIITICPNYDNGCQCQDPRQTHRVDSYSVTPPQKIKLLDGSDPPEYEHVVDKDGNPVPDRSYEAWARDCAIESMRNVKAEQEVAATTVKPPDVSHLIGLSL